MLILLQEINSSGKMKSKDLKVHITNEAVYQLRNVSNNIPQCVLKSAAKEIVNKFPEIYGDRNDKNVIEDGCHSILQKLKTEITIFEPRER